jgi:hypothetical protein
VLVFAVVADAVHNLYGLFHAITAGYDVDR